MISNITVNPLKENITNKVTNPLDYCAIWRTPDMCRELSWTRLPKIESQKTYLVGSKFNIPCSNIQLTPVDNTRQLKENWEPAFDPDLVGLWNSTILATMLLEHLQQKHVCVTSLPCQKSYSRGCVLSGLKMISSTYCAVSAPQWLWVSLDGMWIDVIRYEPLTISLRHFKFFFQQFLWSLQLRSCFISDVRRNKA